MEIRHDARNHARLVLAALAALSLLGSQLIGLTAARAADLTPYTPHPDVAPAYTGPAERFLVDGNATCGQLNPGAAGEIKFDPGPHAGDSRTQDGVTVTITDRYTQRNGVPGLFVDFTVTGPIGISSVFLKQGSGGLLYTYDPTVTTDAGLHPQEQPQNPGTIWADVSHISFCYDEDAPQRGGLEVTKLTVPAGLDGDFPITLTRGGTTLASDTLTGHGASFAVDDLDAASNYRLEETVPTGWDPDYEVACTIDGAPAIDGDGNITVAATRTTMCTITNTVIPPTITLIKTVVNRFGGTAVADDFQAHLDGAGVAWSTPIATTVGSHAVSETVVAGYEPGDWGGDCAADGSITLGPGEDATCTIVNADIQPTLTIDKIVDNTGGGNATPDDFQGRIDGMAVEWDTAVGLDAGSHTASEDAVAGYEPGQWSGDCAPDGSVDLSVGDAKSCTITNTAIPPELTVIKQVVNDDGGTLGLDDFPLFVTEAGGSAEPVSSGASNVVTAGVSYAVSETQQPGYVQTALSCIDEDTGGGIEHPVTLELAQQVTCTIINDDVAPGLTVVKQVINDDGGTLGPDAFDLFVNGNPIDSGAAVPNPQAGVSYSLTETEVPGYTNRGVTCVDAEENHVSHPVTLGLAQSVLCTITNDDITPTLTLVKELGETAGGTLEPGDFDLRINGDTVAHNVAHTVVAGTHTIDEVLPDGYTLAGIECDNEQSSATNGLDVELGLADDVVCTFTNDEIAPTLTVIKSVVGGPAGPGDFGLLVTAAGGEPQPVVNGDTNQVLANVAYTVGEVGVAPYVLVSQECFADGTDVEVDQPVMLQPGDAVTCFLVNAFADVTLDKTVVSIDSDELVEGEVALVEGVPTLLVDAASGDSYELTYQFTVTNTGEVTLYNLALTDPLLGGPVDLADDTLAAGASTTGSASYLVTAADIAAGTVPNTATVAGDNAPEGGDTVTDTDDEVVEIVEVLDRVLGLEIVKEALIDPDGDGNKTITVRDGEDAAVTYRYTITNTGNEDLFDLTLEDDVIGDVTDELAAVLDGLTLPAAATVIVEVDYNLTAAQIEAGEVTNVAVVTGTDEFGVEVTDDDGETIFLVEVLEVVIPRPPDEPESEALPRTGADTTGLTALGVLAAALGAATLLFAPRRKGTTT